MASGTTYPITFQFTYNENLCNTYCFLHLHAENEMWKKNERLCILCIKRHTVLLRWPWQFWVDASYCRRMWKMVPKREQIMCSLRAMAWCSCTVEGKRTKIDEHFSFSWREKMKLIRPNFDVGSFLCFPPFHWFSSSLPHWFNPP